MAPPTPTSKKVFQSSPFNKHLLVKDEDYDLFQSRCQGAYTKTGIVPKPRVKPLDVFGTRPLGKDTTRPLLYGKLRAFIVFLLKSGKYDDSLLIFHQECPVGAISVESAAVVEFLHFVCTDDEKPVCDQQFSSSNLTYLCEINLTVVNIVATCYLY